MMAFLFPPHHLEVLPKSSIWRLLVIFEYYGNIYKPSWRIA